MSKAATAILCSSIAILSLTATAQAAPAKKVGLTNKASSVALASKPAPRRKLARLKSFNSWEKRVLRDEGSQFAANNSCGAHKSAWRRSGDWRSIVDYYTCRY